MSDETVPAQPGPKTSPDKTDDVEVVEVEAGRVAMLEEELAVYDHRRHREGTAKLLAILFIAFLVLVFVSHYIGTLVLAAKGNKEGVESLKGIFDVVLPVASSLASGASTYYFTRDKQ